MEKKQTYDKKQEIVDLQSKIDKLEKKVSRLEKNNKELKDESERHKRMAMYIESRHKDLWDERIIMVRDIVRMQQQLKDYEIANDKLLEANFKLSKKLEDATGKKYDPDLFIDASTQTDFFVNNNKATIKKERRSQSYGK